MRQATGRQIAREYWREMIRVAVAPLNALIRERLIAQLPGLETIARGELGLDSMRADVADYVRRIIEEIESSIIEEVPESALAELARRKGTQVSDQNRRALQQQFQRVLGIDAVAADPALDRRLNFFSAENVRLIKNMQREHMARIGAITTNGLAAGKSARELTREIEKANGIPRRRAALIARDQVSKLNGQINKARQEASGVTHFTWRTVGDERVRDEHEQLDGMTFSWAEGAPDEGFPGQPVNCRCVAEPVLE
jgi:SPP1 gp7 family putative phage head morphogenesis protein